MHLSVIIPAYNEAKRLPGTLESVNAYLSKQSYEYEILVVNDGSTDATESVISKLQIPNFKLISNKINRGKGAVVQQGMLAASGDYRLFMDADNSTTIDQIENMMPHFSKGYDIVIGSLAVPGTQVVRGEPWYRVLAGKLGNKFIQIFAVWGIHDTQRGFKLFSAKAAQDIFSRLTIFGWGFDVEALAVARKLGYKIKEVPVIWNNDPNSKVNIWAYPKVLMQTLQVRWNLLTGKYVK